MATSKNVSIEQWVVNNSPTVWQNVWSYQPLAWVRNYIVNTWTKQQNDKNRELATQAYTSARRTDQTIWWYNYYLPNNQNPWEKWTSTQVTQWSKNALVNSWAVAGIPQWPNLNVDLNNLWTWTPIETPATQPTPAQPTTQKKSWWTKQTTVSPVQTPQEPQTREPYADIVNWTWPIWVQKQQPVDNTNNEAALANMQNDLAAEWWKIYWKFSEDSGNPVNWINTLVDTNSVQVTYNQTRIANIKSLMSQDPHNVAMALANWVSMYSENTMRDLMEYNPTMYQQIQDELKKIQAWDNTNAIASGEKTTSTTQASTSATNTWVDTWAEWISTSPQQTWDVINSISETMSNNQVASTATQEMLNMNAQIAEYEEKINNLQSEARKAFKWDVPQYVYDAYVSNKRQQYQSEINKLQSRYTAALDLYKTELSNAQWQKEMELKYLQYQQNVSNDNWTRYYQSQQLLQDSIKRVNWAAYKVDPTTWTYVQLTDQTAYNAYTADVSNLIQWYTSQFYEWKDFGQCEVFTDNFTEATTGLRMEWADGRSWTYASEKLSYVNDVVPAVWSVIVAAWWAYDSTYWHTMLITWYDPSTWIMNLMWSNSNWDQKIHTSTTTLADIARNSQAYGIRNPYKTKVAQSAAQWWEAASYSYYANPMHEYFVKAYEWATVAAERADIQAADDSYALLYELAQWWYLDKLANSDEFNVLLSEISNWKFSDGSGNINFDKITKYARNKLKDEDIAYAMDRFHRLIEKKLRKESWAAISQTEWNSNFDMYLPNVWQTPEYRYKRLAALERDIVVNQLPPKYRTNYIPIMWSSVREIR